MTEHLVSQQRVNIITTITQSYSCEILTILFYFSPSCHIEGKIRTKGCFSERVVGTYPQL